MNVTVSDVAEQAGPRAEVSSFWHREEDRQQGLPPDCARLRVLRSHPDGDFIVEHLFDLILLRSAFSWRDMVDFQIKEMQDVLLTYRREDHLFDA